MPSPAAKAPSVAAWGESSDDEHAHAGYPTPCTPDYDRAASGSPAYTAAAKPAHVTAKESSNDADAHSDDPTPCTPDFRRAASGSPAYTVAVKSARITAWESSDDEDMPLAAVAAASPAAGPSNSPAAAAAQSPVAAAEREQEAGSPAADRTEPPQRKRRVHALAALARKRQQVCTVPTRVSNETTISKLVCNSASRAVGLNMSLVVSCIFS